jgi:hypothetical protein
MPHVQLGQQKLRQIAHEESHTTVQASVQDKERGLSHGRAERSDLIP